MRCEVNEEFIPTVPSTHPVDTRQPGFADPAGTNCGNCHLLDRGVPSPRVGDDQRKVVCFAGVDHVIHFGK